MTDEEQIKTDIHSIKNKMTAFGARLELLYAALVGNEISKDGGLVADISEHKVGMMELSKRMDRLEKSDAKKSIYVNIIWGAAGAIIYMIAQHFIK